MLACARFQKTILDFYWKKGRTFPWRETRDPYAILVSEMMLQQTQAERVVPFFRAWMKQFPTVQALARASLKEVLLAWQGLGYNRRALYLKQAAGTIVGKYGGNIPKSVAEIDALPGVGSYTAGAIAAFAWNLPVAFVETNIRTVFLHFFFKGRKNVRDEEILELVQRTLPNKLQGKQGLTFFLIQGRTLRVGPCSVREWYNALMDYGAMLKRTIGNPNKQSAAYVKQSAFKGSRRELRGEILRRVARKGIVAASDFKAFRSQFSVANVLADLVAEGFLEKKGERFNLGKA